MNRTMAFLIFFSIVLAIYGLINFYIFYRGLQSIPVGSAIRPWYQWGFWAIASLYILGRFLEKIYLSQLSDVLVWTGSFWLAAMLYFFLIVFFFDLLRMVNHIIPFFPEWVTLNMAKTRIYLMNGSIVVVGLLLLGGFINARMPRIKQIDIEINKPAGNIDQLHAVVMSDIHLGTIVGKSYFERIVRKVNALSPDIILLPGDILDEDIEPVLRQNIGETLRQLKAPLGVYAIMGNHEHIGGSDRAFDYLQNHGIHILRDSVMLIGNGIYLAGREDRDKARFGGSQRIPLEELLKGLNRELPVILMDHQPYYLEKAAELGVDLQLSGHTHHGQLWPLSYITKAIFTISRGYGKVEQMHAYVSNGVGTWGPPIRIGNRPEIVSLNIHFARSE